MKSPLDQARALIQQLGMLSTRELRRRLELSEAELDELEVLLEQPDQFLYAWIIGREPAPPEFDTQLLKRISAFRVEARGTRSDLGS